MSLDIRSDAAKYYDYNPEPPDDIPFYISQLPSPQASVLELGCGTGRVTIPISKHCRSVHGIDVSPAMIAICREKLRRAEIPPDKVVVETGDITSYSLNKKFDLVIAPFRVFQNLETDTEVTGFFHCLAEHLAPHATCILNVFNPNRDRLTMVREWVNPNESMDWEVLVPGGKITCHDRRPRLDPDNLVLYPELIYRRYEHDVLIDEAVLKIVMRCYYPQEFTDLITQHGYALINRWGGYSGEIYGQGPELVIQFQHSC